MADMLSGDVDTAAFYVDSITVESTSPVASPWMQPPSSGVQGQLSTSWMPQAPHLRANGGRRRGNHAPKDKIPRDVCRRCFQRCHWENECSLRADRQSGTLEASDSAPVREVRSVRNLSDIYLDITVNGKSCLGLVDTGSDKSLIPRRLLPRPT